MTPSSDPFLQPVVLRGEHVRLEPVTEAHVDALWSVADHRELWQHMPIEMTGRAHMEAFVRNAMKLAASGSALWLVQVSRPGDKVVGATGFWAADAAHRRVEIGATWITPRFQKTAINTEAKLLMLTHAFETLGCIRVEFKTDSLNRGSQRSLDRIGAVREGTLRHHMIMTDGRHRHSVYYSVVRDEWPQVKARLSTLLREPR